MFGATAASVHINACCEGLSREAGTGRLLGERRLLDLGATAQQVMARLVAFLVIKAQWQ